MTSKQVKEFFASGGVPVKVRSINGKHNKQPITWFIEARTPHYEIPNDKLSSLAGCKTLRTLALRVIYPNMQINDEAIAGNVQYNSISMSPSQWDKVIEWYKRLQTA